MTARRPASRRRALLALLAPPALLVASASPGQYPSGADRPPDPERFLAFAHSSAVLQERASSLAASKDTRPEVKEFARGMRAFREQQLARLRTVAQERALRLPRDEEFEHKVVLENLEPLDFLALSRRYAEIQSQALAQEIRGYEAAERSADEGLKRLAAEMLPQLRQLLEAAHRLQDAVKP